ncbi:MAG: hypothetical protein ACK5QT_03355 [Oligoflexia bacterium]
MPDPIFKVFIPAVLQSGDGLGFQAMEFPALNLVFAPVWSLGPWGGQWVARMGVTAVVGFLTWSIVRIWSRVEQVGPERAAGFWLIPVFSFATGWWGKFFPDLAAAQLAFLGMGLVLASAGVGSSLKRKRVFGACLFGLGCLMKPNEAVVLLALPWWVGQFGLRFSTWVWFVPGVILTALYYLKVIPWIASLQDGSGLFFISPRHPVQALMEFFAQPEAVVKMSLNRLFFAFGTPAVLFAAIWIRPSRWFRGFLVLWLQVLCVAALAGAHVFVHDYYFMGLVPVACILFWDLLLKLGHATSLLARAGFLILLFGASFPSIEQSWVEIAPWVLRAQRHETRLRELVVQQECRRLRAERSDFPWGQGLAFRSAASPYPQLGLCMGEREQSSQAEFGFFRKGEPIPADCRSMEPLGQEIILVRCTAETAAVPRTKNPADLEEARLE